jgi:hypothetical protein
LRDNDIWIISRGKPVKLDLSKIGPGIQLTPVMEYRISDLARYLLNPSPIEVKKILVGCEVHYHQPLFDKIKEKLRQLLPKRLKGVLKEKRRFSETLIVKQDKCVSPLRDKDLESHVDKIRSALKVYDPILKSLSNLDRDEICTITGICEDIGGNRSLLNLKGDIDDKISYIASYMLKDVGVVLEKAHVSDGLFEMSGFDFASYDAGKTHRLIKFYADGKPKFCVIGFDGKVEYWVDNINLVNQMHLLQHSLKANPKFNNSLSLCSKGNAKPLRLLFKKQLEIDYTKSPLPALYKTLFDNYKLRSNEKSAVMKSLQNSQFGILFNYVPVTSTGEKKLLTSVSVMHDVRALEPIKEDLPELYSMINKMASISEAGKYYLLDSIRGYGNE